MWEPSSREERKDLIRFSSGLKKTIYCFCWIFLVVCCAVYGVASSREASRIEKCLLSACTYAHAHTHTRTRTHTRTHTRPRTCPSGRLLNSRAGRFSRVLLFCSTTQSSKEDPRGGSGNPPVPGDGFPSTNHRVYCVLSELHSSWETWNLSHPSLQPASRDGPGSLPGIALPWFYFYFKLFKNLFY